MSTFSVTIRRAHYGIILTPKSLAIPHHSMNDRKPCHNCRRRRLRCDRSVPACYKCTKTGQRCLGYGKLYRWVDSEAPVTQKCQGRSAALMNFTESNFLFQDRAHGRKPYDNSALGKLRDGPQQKLKVSLADPLLQDLTVSSRHYLSYCTYSSLFIACW